MANFTLKVCRCIIGCAVALFMSVLPDVASAQNRNVSGVVTDQQGEPLSGVVVTQQGTANVALTDATGKFSISVPAGATLDLSLMGYTATSIATEGRTTVNVTMQQDLTTIDDVVVVGYGTVKKSDMTGSVSVLGDTKLKTVTTPRVEDMLSGKAPGVFVGSGSGQPGSAGVIIIRGKTSINGSTDPLWVIDGVIVGTSAGDLNPADIESMTVLKDAASTAIYGSQGSNGVVIVSTKRGRVGKAIVNLSAKSGATFMNEGKLKMMDATQLYDLWNSYPNKESFATKPWWGESLKQRNFNWRDNLKQTGWVQDYALSIRGGSEKLKAYTSLNWYDETGTVKGYEYQRFTGRVNFDWQVYDWLTVKPAASISRRDVDDRRHSITAMYQNLPWNSPYNSDGSLVAKGVDADPEWVTQASNTSYMWNNQWNYTTDRAYEISGNFDFNVKITPWLTFESVNNYRSNTLRRVSYTDKRSIDNSDGGSLYNMSSETYRYYFNHLLRFNKTFNEKHAVTAIAAYEWNDYRYEWSEFTRYEIPPGGDNMGLTRKMGPGNGSISDWAMQSFFVNATYSYDNKYYAQASVRSDGSSRFGEYKRYGNFFSLSGSWNIHRENFFEPLSNIVNNLKLRASFGSTGNQPRELYDGYSLYVLDNNASYSDVSGAIMRSREGNKNMTWETTYTANLGVDLSMWNSRLNLSVDIYNKATSGMLWPTPLPSAWGVSSVYRNVGNVNNKGIEITIDGDVIRTKDWRWNIGANIGSNRNRVKELYGGLNETMASGEINLAGIASRILKIGYDQDTWYIAEWAGVNSETGAPQWYTNDANGRNITGKYSEAKRVTMGSYTPKIYGGFNTALSWKFIDLNAVFAFSAGGKIYNYSRQEYDSDGAYSDRNQMVLAKGWSRWEKPGDNATHPQARYNGNNSSNSISSRYLEDGSYLKLKSITLGANLPIKSKVISGVRVYVSGENLFTITKYSGVDPEIPVNDSSGFNRVVGTVGPGVYPGVKRVMFGANLTF
jgi:TonB-linked SusC/RagA family outer membrane protein